MLINEIPIEVRKINGVTKVLLRKYLIKWSGISLSTNLRVSSDSVMLLEKVGIWIDNAINVIENAKRASLKETTYSTLI
jgi:hypothetical protein